MLILNQSSKPMKVTFSYPGKAHFPLKHLRRYNITPEGTDSTWTTLDVPYLRTVCALPHLLRCPHSHACVSWESSKQVGSSYRKSPKEVQRTRKCKEKKYQKHNHMISIQRETKQSRTLVQKKKPCGNSSVTNQVFYSLEKTVREQIPSHDTGTGGNFWKEPLAG